MSEAQIGTLSGLDLGKRIRVTTNGEKDVVEGRITEITHFLRADGQTRDKMTRVEILFFPSTLIQIELAIEHVVTIAD